MEVAAATVSAVDRRLGFSVLGDLLQALEAVINEIAFLRIPVLSSP